MSKRKVVGKILRMSIIFDSTLLRKLKNNGGIQNHLRIMGLKSKTQGINSKDLSKIPKTSIITEFFVMADDLEFSPAPVSPIFGSPNFQTHRAHHAKNKRALNNIKNSAQKQQLAIQSELQLETQQEIQNRLKREAFNNNKKEKRKRA